ncbi:uncharacterized protein LOC128172327 [Crassostrea angulata]|nr:uncharacterized protein LOC105327077 [Crassostrea gigas]XP_052676402.1 uncharacterized protein LOC128157810 [Crassostrea angulata]XP_052694078.1 uncharacterized protein LOC128172327 [Crassostrea angulata]|eukprot:XP_011425675.1 PREDICTED: uncharacterized protein LOC105327077 [Crassostrea gigas]
MPSISKSSSVPSEKQHHICCHTSDSRVVSKTRGRGIPPPKMTEMLPRRKNVVAAFCGNKQLCRKGIHLRAKEKEVTCPRHEDCTATIPLDTTIGDEKRWAAECINELHSIGRPLIISHFTSDRDSAAASGASGKQGHVIENHKDLHHFFDTQRQNDNKGVELTFSFIDIVN